MEPMRKEISMVRLKQVTRRWMNQKGLNSSKGDTPQSSMDLDSLRGRTKSA
jgi:hypothetical protein